MKIIPAGKLEVLRDGIMLARKTQPEKPAPVDKGRAFEEDNCNDLVPDGYWDALGKAMDKCKKLPPQDLSNDPPVLASQPLAPAESEWIPWGGMGYCPVSRGLRIDVKWKSGHSSQDVEAGCLCWDIPVHKTNAAESGVIIAYRLAKAPQ